MQDAGYGMLVTGYWSLDAGYWESSILLCKVIMIKFYSLYEIIEFSTEYIQLLVQAIINKIVF